jgi:alpha-D-ribose 1-methylphosphonate 5-triphosphate synthase subunit PhnH
MRVAAAHPVSMPGFDDPVFDSQRVFRAALDAYSHPGRRIVVDTRVRAPAPLAPATAAFLLTLADFETPVWLQHADAALCAYLRFHCGAPITDDPGQASFAVVTDPETMPALERFNPGEPEYPDRSATVLIQTRDTRGPGRVRLHGPGIAGAVDFAGGAIHARFWVEWKRNDALFPCGVDVVFSDGDALCALPRTTQAEL